MEIILFLINEQKLELLFKIYIYLLEVKFAFLTKSSVFV